MSVNMLTYAASRGETIRGFLDYCWRRTHNNKKCTDGSIDKAVRLIADNPYHNPIFVTEWFNQRRTAIT